MTLANFEFLYQLETQRKFTQKEESDQWNRLFRTETLSSKRREVFHFDPQVTATGEHQNCVKYHMVVTIIQWLPYIWWSPPKFDHLFNSTIMLTSYIYTLNITYSVDLPSKNALIAVVVY